MEKGVPVFVPQWVWVWRGTLSPQNPVRALRPGLPLVILSEEEMLSELKASCESERLDVQNRSTFEICDRDSHVSFPQPAKSLPRYPAETCLRISK